MMLSGGRHRTVDGSIQSYLHVPHRHILWKVGVHRLQEGIGRGSTQDPLQSPARLHEYRHPSVQRREWIRPASQADEALFPPHPEPSDHLPGVESPGKPVPS